MSAELGPQTFENRPFHPDMDYRAVLVRRFLERTHWGLTHLHEMLADGSLEEYLEDQAREEEITTTDCPAQPATCWDNVPTLGHSESGVNPFQKVMNVTALHRLRLGWIFEEFVPSSGLEAVRLGRKGVVKGVDFDPRRRKLVGVPGGYKIVPSRIVLARQSYPPPSPDWPDLLQDLPFSLHHNNLNVTY